MRELHCADTLNNSDEMKIEKKKCTPISKLMDVQTISHVVATDHGRRTFLPAPTCNIGVSHILRAIQTRDGVVTQTARSPNAICSRREHV